MHHRNVAERIRFLVVRRYRERLEIQSFGYHPCRTSGAAVHAGPNHPRGIRGIDGTSQ